MGCCCFLAGTAEPLYRHGHGCYLHVNMWDQTSVLLFECNMLRNHNAIPSMLRNSQTVKWPMALQPHRGICRPNIWLFKWLVCYSSLDTFAASFKVGAHRAEPGEKPRPSAVCAKTTYSWGGSQQAWCGPELKATSLVRGSWVAELHWNIIE